MRWLAGTLVVVMVTGIARSAAAVDAWSEVWSPDPGFAVEFPAAPTFATRPVPGNSEGRQQYWVLERDGRMFVVSVVEMPATTTPPVPTIDYYGRVIERYAAGSHAMLREDYPATVAGLPGFEAVLDDLSDDVHHLLDVLQVGNRLYMVGSAGPHGHETGADAIRFRDSFRLTPPPSE